MLKVWYIKKLFWLKIFKKNYYRSVIIGFKSSFDGQLLLYLCKGNAAIKLFLLLKMSWFSTKKKPDRSVVFVIYRPMSWVVTFFPSECVTGWWEGGDGIPSRMMGMLLLLRLFFHKLLSHKNQHKIFRLLQWLLNDSRFQEFFK